MRIITYTTMALIITVSLCDNASVLTPITAPPSPPMNTPVTMPVQTTTTPVTEIKQSDKSKIDDKLLNPNITTNEVKPADKPKVDDKIISTNVTTNEVKLPDKPKIDDKLLNTNAQPLSDDDFQKLFMDDLKNIIHFDANVEKQLSLLLERANTDPIALDFIFTQALDGSLITLLKSTQAEIDKKLADYKAEEVFTPVQIDNNKPNDVVKKNAEQQEKVKEAKETIDNLFSQVNNKIATNTQMPSINFGVPGQTSTVPKPTGADLPRVASDVKLDANGKPIQNDEFKLIVGNTK